MKKKTIGRKRLSIVLAVMLPLTATAQDYDRAEWGGWIDADGDCQDTRVEVLVEERIIGSEENDACRIRSGVYGDPFTGEALEYEDGIDIDHVIPLRWAHDHGGADWPREKKRAFANDLSDPYHLVATSASVNRSKGAKGPSEWRPPSEEAWCWYGRAWRRITQRWELWLPKTDQLAIFEMVRRCE